jgi:ribosomal protein L44E
MRMMEGMNSIMIYCKNFCKHHNVLLVQQYYDNKKTKIRKKYSINLITSAESFDM